MTTKTIALLLLVPAAALAEPKRPEAAHKRVRELWQELAMIKIREDLDLDEATAAKLASVLKAADTREAEVHKKMHEAREALRAEIKSGKPDEKRLTGHIDALLRGRDEVQKIQGDRIREVRKILPIEKQARLVLLLPRLERRMHRMIEEAEAEDGPPDRGPGPRGGPGPGPRGRNKR